MSIIRGGCDQLERKRDMDAADVPENLFIVTVKINLGQDLANCFC